MQTITTKPDASEITAHKGGGFTINGRDGMHYFRALNVRMGLSLWIKSGIRLTRAVGPTQLLALASEYTGKQYKRNQHQQAMEDLQVWIDTMKAALPFTDERDE
jgi:hypothetical protein